MQNTVLFERDIQLDDVNPLDFFGVNNEKLNLIRAAYPDVKIIARGSALKTYGEPDKLDGLNRLVEGILREIRNGGSMQNQRVLELLDTKIENEPSPDQELIEGFLLRGPTANVIRARTAGQRRIVELSKQNDIVFAIGPAGSGKTYTAVAMAVKALKDKQVKKIILCRPAVEAGERLGFLPGDLKEKIDPYLRPLYDSLEDMIPAEKLKFYLEKNVIEIVPLAYMRGRTLNYAYIILDEAQNATETQLKMFLTRMGVEAKIIVTGDLTQIDLPRSMQSGLKQAARILSNVEGIGFVELNDSDVVRHRLVKSILKAYRHEDEQRNLAREQRGYEGRTTYYNNGGQQQAPVETPSVDTAEATEAPELE